MNKWLKMIKVKAILPAAALIAAAAIGTTFAWQQWDLSVTNQLKAHDNKIEVYEPEFHPDTGGKQVEFVNRGTSSVFLRVSYTEYWEAAEADGSKRLLSDVYTDQDGKVKKIATKHWKPVWPEYEQIEAEDPAVDPGKFLWTDGGDGWYYYNRILKPAGKEGDMTELIMDKVIFQAGLPDGYQKDYYKLFFKAEAVQCSDGTNTLNRDAVNNDATSEVFGKSPKTIDYETGVVTW